MNKTININLGGLFFHIDEDAYKKLQRYLNAISKSLNDDEQGKNEIIADIEARISELLSEKIKDARQVVNQSDIDEIIKIMGQPEDYFVDEAIETEPKTHSFENKRTTGKKLFRDGDDKFIAGVASGLGHYIGVNAVWIRLGFILLAFSGFSIITYIILWIAIPQAESTAEKLQMEGEPVNIDNIERKIREEFENAAKVIKNSADEISENIKGRLKKKSGKTGIQKLITTLGNIFKTLFGIIGKFIGIILTLVSAVIIIGLIISAFSFGSLNILNFETDLPIFTTLLYSSIVPLWLQLVFVIIIIGIPVFVLFILGLRIISSNVKQMSKTTSLSLLGLWLVTLFGILFIGIEIGTSTAQSGRSVEKKEFNFTAKDTITLIINLDNPYEDYKYYYWNHNKNIVHLEDRKKVINDDVKIKVMRSHNTNASIEIKKKSEGRNYRNANKNAETINYTFKTVNKTIIFDNYFSSQISNVYKNEYVEITLYIPKGITVYFDNSLKNNLSYIENTTDT